MIYFVTLWYCMVLYVVCIALYCIVSYDILCYLMLSNSIACYWLWRAGCVSQDAYVIHLLERSLYFCFATALSGREQNISSLNWPKEKRKQNSSWSADALSVQSNIVPLPVTTYSLTQCLNKMDSNQTEVNIQNFYAMIHILDV